MRHDAIGRAAPVVSTFAAAIRAAAMLTVTQSGMAIPIPGLLASGRFPRRQFAKGSFIKQPDDKTDHIYLIETGKVVTFFLGPQGHDVSFLELGAGDFVGDLSAFGSDEPATYFQAVEDTVALVLNRGQFLEALRNQPEFAELVAKTLCSRLRLMKQLYIESKLLPMKTRLYADLIRHGVRDERGQLRISPMPTHAEVARRIASQRETVTRHLSQLAKQRVIDSSRGFIVITDEAYLRAEISKALGGIEWQ
ncbi:Crp/Fnr family transcriptional regulator [Bosea sp. SSUT16]|uniref:Crp/Fnr family transcriptional regulator n=1 Tax=Bosea spartocytisi TaxID=2773451 RepID=A0A927EEM8_9HYPH|nr:Crp/Fnr family transcriptional regulator [Bosea spartocytisi]MBD3849518.1 Crp/Fnr family transcriptional regulator [Bosea spartocytisi]MCT4475352.1 Crp/Fnr family transcriptional regulator [Bosea spartocytisi]